MSELSLAALTILDAGPAGQVRAADAAGFRSVGLRLKPLLPTDPAVVGDPERERELEELVAQTAMAVLEVGVFRILPELDPRDDEPVIAFSARLGARFLVCPVEDPDRERRAATFAALCDRAAVHGLEALVEFNPYSACPSLADAVALVEAARRPNAGLVIDVMHLSRSGGHPSELAAVDPALLRLLQLCDAPRPPPGPRSVEELRAESRGGRRLPGEGELWLDELLDALPDDVAISLAAPDATTAHRPAAERARRAWDVTTASLARR